MANPVTITFPDGLAPHLYADVMATVNGDQTSATRHMLNEVNRAVNALIGLGASFGMTPEAMHQALNSEGYDDDNFAGLAEAIRAHLKLQQEA